MLLPREDDQLRTQIISRDTYKVKSALPSDVESLLARLIQREAEAYARIEKTKQTLASRYDFAVLVAFTAIDSEHSHAVGVDSVLKYMNKHGVGHYADAVSFVRRLDSDLDCKLSYTEFMEGIMPAGNVAPPKYATPTKSSLRHAESETKSRASPAQPRTSPSKKSSPQSKGLMFVPGSAGTMKTPDRSGRKSPLRSSAARRGPLSPSIFDYSVEKGFGVLELMREQIALEKRVELARQNLAIKKDVAMGAIYNRFDPERKGYATALDFMGLLESLLGPTASKEEMYALFNRFDSDMDGRLKFAEVASMFMPRQQEYASVFAKREGGEMGPESVKLMKRLVQTYVETERENARLKGLIRNFRAREEFEQLDRGRRGYFAAEDV